MSKRRAAVQLTRDDLDKEDEEEAGRREVEDEEDEPGVGFKPASKEVLEKRVIRKARRSGAGSGAGKSTAADTSADDGEEEEPTLAFNLFQGINLKPSSSSFGSGALFSFGSFGGQPLVTQPLEHQPPAVSIVVTPAVDSMPQQVTEAKKVNGDHGVEGKEEAASIMKETEKEKEKKERQEDEERDPLYYRKLKDLNTSFLKWVQEHVTKGAGKFDFTPTCNDYVQHAASLDKKYPVKGSQTSFFVPSTSSWSQPQLQPNSVFTFGSTQIAVQGSFASDFVFPSSQTTPSGSSVEGSSQGVNFSQSQDLSNSGNSDTETGDRASNGEKKEQEALFKDHALEIKEADCLYSTSIRLFYKVGSKFETKGKGLLYIKRTDIEGKSQLLIRQKTTIGTIWLNIILASQLPISKLKKKDILLVCVPNPPVDDQPKDEKETVSYLLRCESEAAANELLAKLEAYKS